MKTQVTIYDIARHLNISKSTVSRALTGHPNINSETRRSVLDLAEKMDYQRNTLSISLIKNKTYTIGVLVPEFSTSFYPQVVAEVQRVAAEAGYNIVISLSNDCYETEVANAAMLLSRKVDGLLVSLSNQTQNFDHLKKFQRRGIPVVLLNSVCNELLMPRVMVNDYDASFKAVEYLIRSGKQRISHLAGPGTSAVNQRRLSGYLDALKKNGLPVREELIIPYDLKLNKVKIYVRYLLNLPQAADAIFAVNDPSAIEAIKAIKSLGLRVPEDMAVIGFGNNYGAECTEPGLTTLNHPVAEMGRSAINLLLQMVQDDASKWRAITKSLEAQLIVRGSA
ncbi:LacI family DNA-binding transcriptional regulator [Desertivirga arenae]|uniref:LacI family DNA-binding transcriptional regulator n=1 Tax=Desertivirga arenae TaxID=2810309 RepID=UPI001A95BE59|nr:LacI family DNA-binding transcriptional regulator [Pedobacter sp. SYSU D00823]